MKSRPTRALIATHSLSAAAEWAVVPGVLVHGFVWGGTRAVGIVSLALLLPLFAGAPLIAAAQTRWPTYTTRVVALTVQLIAYGAAAATTAFGAPTPLVAPFVVAGLCAFMLVPPTTAALLPHIAQSAPAMVRANLWVTYGDSSSGLLGSLAAALLLGFGGPAAVFVACTATISIGLIATIWRTSPTVRTARTLPIAQPRQNIRRTIQEFRCHAWGRAVVTLLSTRNLLLGAFDVLLVIVALDNLGMSEAGPGYLSAMLGAGALVSTVLTTRVVRRAKLRIALFAAISLTALSALLLGGQINRPIVFLVLPIIGVAMAMIDALSRTVMIRSIDPRNIAPLYASLSFVGGLSQVVGSVLAQVGLALADAHLSFAALGVLLLVVSALAARSLRQADETTEIPVVEMALLSARPMLAALPSNELEQVARAAETIAVAPGDSIVEQGDLVDACYVIAEGECSVVTNGRSLAAVGRGDVIGEVALLSRTAASASIVAITDTKLLRIERRLFLLALTGHDFTEASRTADLAGARDRFREVVAAHERTAKNADAARPDVWLGLGAAGRMLGDASFTSALERGADLASTTNNEAALAEAAALAIWPGAFFFVADNPDHQMIELCERALAELRPDDPLRVRVLAALASNLAFASPLSTRRELINEAHALAAANDNPTLKGVVLNAEFISMWEPATFARRAEIGVPLAAIGQQVGDPALEYLGRFFGAFCAVERGDLRSARRELVALRALAPRANNEYFDFLAERLLLSIDIAQGQPGTRPRIDVLAARHAATYADTDGTWALQVGGLAYESGDLGTMVPALTDMLDGPHARTWHAALALAHVQTGDRDAAAAVIAQLEEVPKSYFWLTVMQTRAEAAANLELHDLCADLFEQLLPFRDHVGITASGSRILGLVSRSLGELALVLERTPEAIALLEQAAATATEADMVFEAVICRRLLAQAYRAAGEPERASSVAALALQVARARGYQRERELLETLAPASSLGNDLASGDGP